MAGGQIAIDGIVSAYDWIFVPWLVLAGLVAGIALGYRSLTAIAGFIAGSLYAGLMLYLHRDAIPGRIMGESFLVMQIAAVVVAWIWSAIGAASRLMLQRIRKPS